MQATLAFSGRKFKEDTFGGKYINTSETELFKKGNLLFGLNYSRRRMAKEKKKLLLLKDKLMLLVSYKKVLIIQWPP